MTADELFLAVIVGVIVWLVHQNRVLRATVASLRAPDLPPPTPPPDVPPPVWMVQLRAGTTVTTMAVPLATTEADVVRYLLQRGVPPRSILAIVPPSKH